MALTEPTLLDMEPIWYFATTVDINDVKELLDQQIACNGYCGRRIKRMITAQISEKYFLDMDRRRCHV